MTSVAALATAALGLAFAVGGLIGAYIALAYIEADELTELDRWRRRGGHR